MNSNPDFYVRGGGRGRDIIQKHDVPGNVKGFSQIILILDDRIAGFSLEKGK